MSSRGIFELRNVSGAWEATLMYPCNWMQGDVTISGGKVYAPCGGDQHPEIVVLTPGATGYSAKVAFGFSPWFVPNGGLVVGPDGSIYGTSSIVSGCCGGPWWVFRLRPNASGGYDFKGLYKSGTASGPVFGSDGRIFTSEYDPDAFSCGDIRLATPTNSGYTTKEIVKGLCLGGPLVILASGDIYYTDYGDVFQLTPIGDGYARTLIHHFANSNSVFTHLSSLFSIGDGNIYGTNGNGQFFVIYQ
jgi:hypothetical protein